MPAYAIYVWYVGYACKRLLLRPCETCYVFHVMCIGTCGGTQNMDRLMSAYVAAKKGRDIAERDWSCSIKGVYQQWFGRRYSHVCYPGHRILHHSSPVHIRALRSMVKYLLSVSVATAALVRRRGNKNSIC